MAINTGGLCVLTIALMTLFVCLIKCAKSQTVTCDLPTSCKPGDLVSDPNHCQYYFECTSDGTKFKRRKCGKDKYYDIGTNRCRIQRNAKCATVCDSDLNIFHTLENKDKSDMANNLMSEDNKELSFNVSLTSPVEESVLELNEKLDALEGNPEINDTGGPIITTIANDINVTDTTVITTVKETTEDAIVKSTKVEVIVPKITTEGIHLNTSEVGGITKVPPYDLATKDRLEFTTAGNDTVVPTGAGSGGLSTAMIGIICSVAVGVILLIVLTVIIILLIRRRRNRNRHDIPKIENPQYAAAAASKPTNYRFSRNSALYVGPTVNFQKMARTPQDGDSLTRKKRPAPAVPTARQNLLRKKGPAPPPPARFGDTEEEFHPEEQRPLTDIYEKDSNAGSAENLEMSTFTARNDRASVNISDQANRPSGEQEDSKDKVTEPLLKSNSSEKEVDSPNKDIIVRNGGIADKTLNQGELNNNRAADNEEEDAEDVEDADLVNDPNETLLGQTKKGSSVDNVSEDIVLDDYDRSHNPFFS